jgi:hypothetical protein
MSRFAFHLLVALLTLAIGILTFLCWKSFDAAPIRTYESITCFVVEPATSKETVLRDYEAHLNKHCIRRNPEREKLLLERFNQKSRKSKK